MFYKESESDIQEGWGKQQAYYDIPDVPFRVAPYEFHHDFFLQNNCPIFPYLNGGDIVQGENHPFYHLEVPDKYLEPYRVKLYIRDFICTAGAFMSSQCSLIFFIPHEKYIQITDNNFLSR